MTLSIHEFGALSQSPNRAWPLAFDFFVIYGGLEGDRDNRTRTWYGHQLSKDLSLRTIHRIVLWSRLNYPSNGARADGIALVICSSIG